MVAADSTANPEDAGRPPDGGAPDAVGLTSGDTGRPRADSPEAREIPRADREAPGASRPLPPPNLPKRPEPRWDFGLEHRYEPPIEIPLVRPLIAGDRVAFTARLPEPPNGDREDQAFFYRLTGGEIVGYFNRCTHITIPLDYDDGEFLDRDGFIMCRVHGARYELESGLRCAGPARTNLTRILVEEDGLTLRVLGWQKVR
ncbi:MAG: Rieske 2Fe-2S domain-containing protein [Leptospirales bacterium]|jgi:nitrite reductase/ring-hydroxylating ferredoxin subunit